MENITYKYRENLPYVIKNVSFEIQPCEKVAVVGRTGSGKSTLTLGLLRILELVPDIKQDLGKIKLDSVNIADVGLHLLRKRVTIIPQDPVLFTGTVRYNIDPFKEYKDEEIEEVLKKVQLWDSLGQKRDDGKPLTQLEKLDTVVDDGGSNFSLGQRQLICVSRALIKKPKVLLMDEATASIDEMTDHLIQNMIK